MQCLFYFDVLVVVNLYISMLTSGTYVTAFHAAIKVSINKCVINVEHLCNIFPSFSSLY